ncbi:carbohydrate kinase family protein [Actinocorallia longicatena]|uniref:Sugar kinase n=1 Tax=Actinocorallia longicatena TaxID=111803 RepID=A0ABP6QBJ4_9ACTN
MYDVLVIGGAGVDTIVNVPQDLPLPYADSVATPGIAEYAGHTGSGVALGCRSLGLSVKLVDFLGEDRLGGLVRDRLAAGGVDTEFVISPAGTRRAVNLVDPKGRRTSFYDGRDLPGQRLPEGLVAAAPARHVHVSIMDFARHVYPLGDGVTTSTDLHDWDGVNPHHADFARSSDVVFVSATALADVPGTVHALFTEGRALAVVVMDGERGGWFATRADREPRHYEPAAGGPVVDSNGAGDAFVSGFLHAWLRSRAVVECVRSGAVAGLYACGAAGTHQALITLPELEARLTPHP